MATYSATMSGDSRYSITLTITEVVPSDYISTNQTYVNYTLTATKTNGTGYYSNDAKNPVKVVINGKTEFEQNITYNFQGSSPKTITLASGSSSRITHNADGSKSIAVSGSFTDKANSLGSATASGTFTLTTIPRYATSNQSLNSKTETTIKMNWSSDSTCDYIWYSTNNGSNWTAVGSTNGKSGSYTISNLSANTTYNIKTRVRRKDSQLTTDSSALAVQTYNWPYCTVAPSFTIGEDVALQFYNPLNKPISIYMWSYKYGFITDEIEATGTSYTVRAGTDYDLDVLYQSIPNDKNSQYTVDTWCEGHKSTKWDGGYYSVNENTNKPTFEDFVFEDINPTTLALTGDSSIIIPNYSNVQVTIPAANKAVAKNYATMVRYNVNIGSNSPAQITYSDVSDVSTTVNNATSETIIVYAEDSRGLTTGVPKSGIPKSYTDITRGNISITRQDNVGETVTLTFNGAYWGESFGSVTNSITNVTYRFKKTTDTNWTTGITPITPTQSNSTYSFTGGIAGDLGNSGFSIENSFNIEITVSDRLSSTTFTTTLGSGTPNMAFAEGGISINGKYDEQLDNGLQVNGKIYQNGAELIIPTLDTSTSTTSTNGIQNQAITKYFNSQCYGIYGNNTTYYITIPHDGWASIASALVMTYECCYVVSIGNSSQLWYYMLGNRNGRTMTPTIDSHSSSEVRVKLTFNSTIYGGVQVLIPMLKE